MSKGKNMAGRPQAGPHPRPLPQEQGRGESSAGRFPPFTKGRPSRNGSLPLRRGGLGRGAFYKSGLLLPLAGLLLLNGCIQNMWNDSKFKPLEADSAFADANSSRPLPPDTVSRSSFVEATPFVTGFSHGKPTDTFPMPITREVLDRGQQRFDIYCAPCHGRTGEGNGMIVQRGFPAPPSYYEARLVKAPVGHFYQVITNGYGLMYSYADRVAPADRWAIAAYIRVLQRSRNATLSDVPPPVRTQLEGTGK